MSAFVSILFTILVILETVVTITCLSAGTAFLWNQTKLGKAVASTFENLVGSFLGESLEQQARDEDNRPPSKLTQDIPQDRVLSSDEAAELKLTAVCNCDQCQHHRATAKEKS